MSNFEAKKKVISNEPRRKRRAGAALAALSLMSATPAFAQQDPSYLRQQLSYLQQQEEEIRGNYEGQVDREVSNLNQDIMNSYDDGLYGVNSLVLDQLLRMVPRVAPNCRIESGQPVLNGNQLTYDLRQGFFDSSNSLARVRDLRADFGYRCTNIREITRQEGMQLARIQAEEARIETELNGR